MRTSECVLAAAAADPGVGDIPLDSVDSLLMFVGITGSLEGAGTPRATGEEEMDVGCVALSEMVSLEPIALLMEDGVEGRAIDSVAGLVCLGGVTTEECGAVGSGTGEAILGVLEDAMWEVNCSCVVCALEATVESGMVISGMQKLKLP